MGRASLIWLAAAAVAVAAEDRELVSLACSGKVELFAGLPYGVVADLSRQRSIAHQMYGSLKDRVRCHCPDVTDQQFNDRFSPARVVFNLLGGLVEHEEEIPCLDNVETYTRDLYKYVSAQLRGSEITLPETCTREHFMGPGGCRVQLNVLEEMSVNLKMVVAECEDGPIPSFGLWCSGEGCKTLFQPCAGSCATGQECLAGISGVEALLGNGLATATDLVTEFLGINMTASYEHLVRMVDGDWESDRTLDDCASSFASLSQDIMTAFSKAIGAAGGGLCIPTEWKGVDHLLESFYGRWEKMSARPRRDECAPLKPRTDSEFGWRRGQMTDNGQSGGGWCVGYNDCNFHLNSGDCESNDDFEYFMAKLYCKYKQEDGCKAYSPFCYWDPKLEGRYKCLFNHTTQEDGILDDNWTVGLQCSKIDELADKCNAVKDPISSCEHEYCACSGGEWDKTDETCTAPSKMKGKCSDMVGCFGALQQCYEKAGQNSSYMQTPSECESFFLCRCNEIATSFGCDPKLFCGRRCACMYSDKDRFVGPRCDLRLIRGYVASLLTFDPDSPKGAPVSEWDGSLDGFKKSAAKILRTAPVPASLAPPAKTTSDPVVVTTCDGRVFLFPTADFGLSFQLRGLDALAEAVAQASVEAFRCAVDNVSEGNNAAIRQMATAYFFHTPQMWISRFVSDGPSGFFEKGTLADYIFNVSGESIPYTPDLTYLGNVAQNQLEFPRREAEGAGWVPHLTSWIMNGVDTLYYSVRGALKATGWYPTETWHLPLLKIQHEENEEERNKQIKELIVNRQKDVVEAQARHPMKWTGKVKLPKVAEDKIGFEATLPAGNAAVYFSQCPRDGLAEFQFGVSGELSDLFHFRRPCRKHSDCGDEDRRKCHIMDTRLFNAPMYGVDFLGGFLWGGNFTKGFQGGCAILSTTINQMDFSTVDAKCRGTTQWVDMIGSVFKKVTGNPVEEGKPSTWCYADPKDVVEAVLETASDSLVDLSSAKPLTKRPYPLPKAKKADRSHDDEL